MARSNRYRRNPFDGPNRAKRDAPNPLREFFSAKLLRLVRFEQHVKPVFRIEPGERQFVLVARDIANIDLRANYRLQLGDGSVRSVDDEMLGTVR